MIGLTRRALAERASESLRFGLRDPRKETCCTFFDNLHYHRMKQRLDGTPALYCTSNSVIIEATVYIFFGCYVSQWSKSWHRPYFLISVYVSNSSTVTISFTGRSFRHLKSKKLNKKNIWRMSVHLSMKAINSHFELHITQYVPKGPFLIWNV